MSSLSVSFILSIQSVTKCRTCLAVSLFVSHHVYVDQAVPVIKMQLW